MNYRHIYHAGHICDVVKHSVLALILSYMKEKDKAFAVLDTHAGCGLYDLNDPEALKTGEAQDGVMRLWQAYHDVAEQDLPPTLAPYLGLLRHLNPDGTLRLYPGSPLLTLELLRPQDRLIACELHPEDSRTLHRNLRGYTQAQLHNRDGYAALKAFLPFPEKRGLVLIDPPFETPDEFKQLAKAMKGIQTRFPQAVVAVWYPVKDRPTIWSFHEELLALSLDKLMVAEFIYRPEVRHDRLNGSGFVFINPPWVLEEQLHTLFPILHEHLETEAKENHIHALTRS